jgi:hypothetical protein
MHKEYEIKTVLDFTKIPQSKLSDCLLDFTEWVRIMKRAQKVADILTPIDRFVWIDDKQHNITMNIDINKEGE